MGWGCRKPNSLTTSSANSQSTTLGERILTKRVLSILFLCSIALVSNAQREEMKLGIYVVVSNLEVSKSFYEELFGSPAYFENEGFAGFSVSGSLFGIFHEETFTHDLNRGNNSVPYIQVENIQAEYERVKALSPKMVHESIVNEGVISLFMFTDPDGNVIEFFSLSN